MSQVVTFSINPYPPTRADQGFPYWNPPKAQPPSQIVGGQIQNMIVDAVTVNRIPLRDEANHTEIKRIPIPAAPVQRKSDSAKLQPPIPQIGRVGGTDLMTDLIQSINQRRMISQGGQQGGQQ